MRAEMFFQILVFNLLTNLHLLPRRVKGAIFRFYSGLCNGNLNQTCVRVSAYLYKG